MKAEFGGDNFRSILFCYEMQRERRGEREWERDFGKLERENAES